jgi:hypothetical protein
MIEETEASVARDADPACRVCKGEGMALGLGCHRRGDEQGKADEQNWRFASGVAAMSVRGSAAGVGKGC